MGGCQAARSGCSKVTSCLVGRRWCRTWTPQLTLSRWWIKTHCSIKPVGGGCRNVLCWSCQDGTVPRLATWRSLRFIHAAVEEDDMDLQLQAALTRARRLKQKKAARPLRDVAERVEETVQAVKSEPVGKAWSQPGRCEEVASLSHGVGVEDGSGLVFTAMTEFVRGVGTEDPKQERRRSAGAEQHSEQAKR